MSSERSLSPMIGDLKASALARMYLIRLREHAIQEFLAGSGIAVGVALVFGVLVANTSATGSAHEVLDAVIGSAQTQLAARSEEGFSEQLAERASRLSGVHYSAYLLRTNGVIVGPDGRQSIQLVGVTAGLLGFGGAATQDLGAGEEVLSGGIGLPSGVGQAIGAKTGSTVTLLTNGQAHHVLVRAVLNSGAIGALAQSGLAVAQLRRAQALAGKPGRVTQVLIGAYPGAEQRVTGELRRLAAGRAAVEPADHEWQLLSETAKPTSQSTRLFAGISVMVGFLLALNAMLLTVPERRRLIADMISQGFDSRQVRTMLACEAAVLGLTASLVGVALGEVLARTLFAQSPIYLEVAFPVSEHQAVHWTTVAIAVGCGMAATLAATLSPVLDLRSGEPFDAVLHTSGDPGQSIRPSTARKLGYLGGLIILATTVGVIADPDLTVVGGIALAVAAVALIPLAFITITRLLKPVSKRIAGSMFSIAVIETEGTVTRSVALAGVAALAIYGSVAIEGARTDLIRGLDTATVQFFRTADLWITPGTNDLTTTSFSADHLSAIVARVPGVASVRVYQGGLLDDGPRRLWIRARSPNDPWMLQASQMARSELRRATERLRRGGWAAVPEGFASEHHLRVGSSFALPAPAGLAPLRVAAITTNVGWPPGGITLNTTDYQRYWQTTNPAALEVGLKAGVTPAAGRRAVAQALAPTGLRVQTAHERIEQFEGNLREGLHSLADISTLLLLMAALSLAAALSTAIWLRRSRLAAFKTQGYDRWQLWRSLLSESAIVLGIGAADGAILGIYGHALANRWLRITTGFPAPFSPEVAQVLVALLLVAGIALAVVALPGYKAATVPAATSFHE
jgi:putative ABC transport system permease protein